MNVDRARIQVSARLAKILLCARLHAQALLFFSLLGAVLLATLLELPPLTLQNTFAQQAQACSVRDALNQPDKINANTAVVAELICLEGIGTAKANAIIEYRQQHGPFASVDELDKVKGISNGILSKIRHQLTVS